MIQDVRDTLKARTQNGCTGCAYCMPCPFGVDIPNNLNIGIMLLYMIVMINLKQS